MGFFSARMKCAINPSRVGTSATETALISPPVGLPLIPKPPSAIFSGGVVDVSFCYGVSFNQTSLTTSCNAWSRSSGKKKASIFYPLVHNKMVANVCSQTRTALVGCSWKDCQYLISWEGLIGYFELDTLFCARMTSLVVQFGSGRR